MFCHFPLVLFFIHIRTPTLNVQELVIEQLTARVILKCIEAFYPYVCIFFADEEVTGGSVKVLLTIYDFVPIHTEHTFGLCEFLQDVKKNCPVPKGTLDFTIDNEVPMDVDVSRP